jgi:hypothetical protein
MQILHSQVWPILEYYKETKDRKNIPSFYHIYPPFPTYVIEKRGVEMAFNHNKYNLAKSTLYSIHGYECTDKL